MYAKTTCGDALIHYKVLSLIFLCEKKNQGEEEEEETMMSLTM